MVIERRQGVARAFQGRVFAYVLRHDALHCSLSCEPPSPWPPAACATFTVTFTVTFRAAAAAAAAGGPALLLTSLAGGGLLALGASIPLARGDAKLATISPAEIKEGMKGYGLTVFKGTQPERFDVEVIGVLHHFRPGQELIVIKTPNPRLDVVKTVKGMSGSPIYLDGRLAGAYSYSLSAFEVEPVAGVTPIDLMLTEMRRPIPPGLLACGRRRSPARRARLSPAARPRAQEETHASPRVRRRAGRLRPRRARAPARRSPGARAGSDAQRRARRRRRS